jgi:hypothetical protein
MLMKVYFVELPTYHARLFLRCYNMHEEIFAKIVDTCEANGRNFTLWRNNAGLLGFSAYWKISATM